MAYAARIVPPLAATFSINDLTTPALHWAITRSGVQIMNGESHNADADATRRFSVSFLSGRAHGCRLEAAGTVWHAGISAQCPAPSCRGSRRVREPGVQWQRSAVQRSPAPRG